MARRLIELVESLSAAGPQTQGQRVAVMADLDVALQVPNLAVHVVEALLHQLAASQTEVGAHVAAHLADKRWAQPYPLHVQEYAPLFKGGPMLHLSLHAAFQQTLWPRHELKALREALEVGENVLEAAQVLRDDFATIRRQAGELLHRLDLLRELRGRTPMHVVQIEAYLAATLVEGSLQGKQCIDLGCGNGELVHTLQADGAIATGNEYNPEAAGLFGMVEEPQYDLVLATGFMEPGAFVWPKFGVNFLVYNERADELVATAAKLLKPGGLLVVRNVNHPLPFTPRALHAAGLNAQRVLLPFCTPVFGGRLGVWRKTI